jgi:hypothetical protein
MAEIPEQETNRRLRRADWRFLLPSPRPRCALCLAGEPLWDAVCSFAGDVVTAAGKGECDLAVAEDPGPRVLTQLYDALGPGEPCYTEWRGWHSDPWRIEQALREAGFEEVTCYRLWPASAVLPVYWVPVGAPGAAGYVRSRRWLRGGRVRRLLDGARQRARDLARGRWVNPICAIARRPVEDRPGRLELTASLRGGWPTWGLGPTPERFSTLMVTGGQRSVNKVVLLVFAEPGPVPLVALKAPRVEIAAAGIRREAAALASLAFRDHGRLPDVPRLLFRQELDGVPLLGETALLGRPLESVLTRRNLADWSMRVTDCLAAMAGATAGRCADGWPGALVKPILNLFSERFGRVADPVLLRTSEEIVRAMGRLTPVTEQRDFSPWNVLVTAAGGIAVLDWESAEPVGLPALDLLYYLAFACFNVEGAHDGRSRVIAYRRMLDASTPIGAVRRDCLARYIAALDLDQSQLAPLRVLLWMIHAQSEFGRAAEDSGGTPPEEVLAGGLFLALWSEEVRHLAGA